MASEVRDDRFLNSPNVEVTPRQRTPSGPEVAEDRPLNPSGSETVDRYSVEAFCARLEALGATEDEVASTRAHWDAGWDEEAISRADLVRMSDAELSDAIRAGRTEYVEGTMTEDEQSTAERAAGVQRQLNEAERVVRHGTVDQVVDWVGDDPVRAEAAQIAEMTTPDHTPRKTLLAALSPISGVDQS